MAKKNHLRELVRAIQPGDAVAVMLPKFGKRDAYLALNAAAHAEFGRGAYKITAPAGQRQCVLTRSAGTDCDAA